MLCCVCIVLCCVVFWAILCVVYTSLSCGLSRFVAFGGRVGPAGAEGAVPAIAVLFQSPSRLAHLHGRISAVAVLLQFSFVFVVEADTYPVPP